MKKYVAKKFNISQGDLEDIINADAKSYMDYPNNEWFLKPLYDLYKKISNFLNKWLPEQGSNLRQID